MYHLALSFAGALLAGGSWFLSGWLYLVMISLAVFCATFAFLYYVKERRGNWWMFVFCLFTWLTAIVQVFIRAYV